MQMNRTRRALLQRALIASALVPVAGFLVSTAAYGESPALDSSDPTAKALGYVPKSAKPDANCANCSLFQAKAGDVMGSCTIFPGKSVASAGWCSGWVKKAAA
jgi:hypothetical protein